MTNRSIVSLQQRIERIKRDLSALGPLRPGTLSQQYSVCGTAGCRCAADPPIKHGPYYQLSYTWHGKSRTRFVRDSELAQVRQELANYERLRALFVEWIDTALEFDALQRQAERRRTPKSPRKPHQSTQNASPKRLAE
jgi:Family of unknown function (DUF6788)